MPQSNPNAAVAPLELLEDEAIEVNPDIETRRETFELELMEEGRSAEGALADLAEEARHREHA